MQKFVPVVSSTGKPLMPTSNKKADRLVAKGRALRRFNRGVFYIQLLDREDGYKQVLVVGIDPGSKKEAFTVKSEAHTYLNIQTDAVTWVKEHVETRRTMRRTRRFRKTRYRKMRSNRNSTKVRLPPSTRARWGLKLRIVHWLTTLFPIETFVVEDIQAVTKPKQRRWNKSFSPLEVGKKWFYTELGKLGEVKLYQGYETAQERNTLELKKSKAKLADTFEAHCVDSWVLANLWVGGHTEPDNKAILYLVPLRFHRRQLHRLQPEKGGIRKPYGGTISLGLKRGTWVKHPKYGLVYVGGTTNGRISLHSLETGKRLTQKAKPEDCTLLTYASWRMKGVQSPPHA